MHSGQKQKLECALYVVATPIGNLRDISLRALDTLTSVDTIAAEDTRNTSHLLTHYGISANRLMALHQHNERGAAEKVIAQLQQGHSVALVTDAGTPAPASKKRKGRQHGQCAASLSQTLNRALASSRA